MSKRRSARLDPSDQSGLSLTELVVSMGGLVIMLGAILALLSAGVRSQDRSVDRSLTTQATTPAVERLTREIRSARAVQILTPARIDLQTPLRTGAATSTVRHVLWDCSVSRACTRQEGSVNGPLGGRVEKVLLGVENTDVFAGTPGATDPPYVSVKLDVSVNESQPIQFRDGVTVRRLAT